MQQLLQQAPQPMQQIMEWHQITLQGCLQQVLKNSVLTIRDIPIPQVTSTRETQARKMKMQFKLPDTSMT